MIATPHTAGLTLPAIEHQSLETVAMEKAARLFPEPAALLELANLSLRLDVLVAPGSQAHEKKLG